MSAWDDPDFIRDEREANPPDPSELERIRLRAEAARRIRRSQPKDVTAPVSYLRCAACGKRLDDYGDCDSCSYDESEAQRAR